MATTSSTTKNVSHTTTEQTITATADATATDRLFEADDAQAAYAVEQERLGAHAAALEEATTERFTAALTKSLRDAITDASDETRAWASYYTDTGNLEVSFVTNEYVACDLIDGFDVRGVRQRGDGTAHFVFVEEGR